MSATVTHGNTAKEAATNAVTALLGSGAKLVFRLSGDVGTPGAAVATLALASTPFNPANSTTGIAAAGTISPDTNATGNASPIANASLETSGGTIIIHCAVAASSSDINLTNNLTVAQGDTVECSSLTYCALAG